MPQIKIRYYMEVSYMENIIYRIQDIFYMDTLVIIIVTGLVYYQSENCSRDQIKPLILFEFIIGLILFFELTLSRRKITNCCQFFLASICNDECLISAK